LARAILTLPSDFMLKQLVINLIFIIMIAVLTIFVLIAEWINYPIFFLALLLTLSICFRYIMTWLDFVRMQPKLPGSAYILYYMFGYLSWNYLFALLYKGAAILNYGIMDFDGEYVKSFGECFYFSIATFTTLGYGEMKPVHSITRFLSALEVSLGVGLLALIFSVSLAFRRNNNQSSR
jgi:hypothetical protein